MNKTAKHWLLVIVFLLDDIAVAALVLLGLHFLGVDLPLALWLALAAALAGITYLAHKAIIPVFYRKVTTGTEAMVGMCGVVIESLAPVGRIRIAGECWKARSLDECIELGEHVEVLHVESLMLDVRRTPRSDQQL